MSEVETVTAPTAPAPAATVRGISPETVTREVLDNGMVVLVYPNHAIPAINISLSFEAGAIFDPADRNGLASFTARTMRRGTLRKTFERLNLETEERGMTVGVDSGQQLLNVGGRSLAEDAGRLLATIAELARQPAFPLEEIERLRNLTMAGLKEEED